MDRPAPLAVVHHPDFSIAVPAGHRFPMGKYNALMDVLRADGLVQSDSLFEAPQALPAWIKLAHTADYADAVINGTLDRAAQRRIGFDWSPQLVRRSLLASGGTVLCAQLALERGIACHTAGGSHHAAAGYGAGYCVFNDVAIAARVLLEQGRISRALVVDLDVHQGDGTAAIFDRDPRVFTFSMHAENNFPTRKAQSDLDVPLEDHTGDQDYLSVLRYHLAPLLARIRPDIVFYIAGVDPHVNDLLGRLDLTDDGIAARDRLVINTVRGAGIPLAGVLGGGYARDVSALARLHSNLHRAALAACGSRP